MQKIDISLLCCTHGRPFFLGETLECFRRQILPKAKVFEAELLIYNDCPEQTLVCSMPGVRIVNLKTIFESVSDKWNHGFEEARGKWVAPLDDDDISLPFRMKYCYDFIMKFPWINAMKHSRAWYMEYNKVLSRPTNVFFGSSFINRQFYLDHGKAVEGEPTDVSSWQKMFATGTAIEISPTPEETHFIYRWGGMAFHWSGLMDGKMTHKQLNEAYLKGTRADPRWTEGTIELFPKWNNDYEQLIADAIKNRIGE